MELSWGVNEIGLSYIKLDKIVCNTNINPANYCIFKKSGDGEWRHLTTVQHPSIKDYFDLDLTILPVSYKVHVLDCFGECKEVLGPDTFPLLFNSKLKKEEEEAKRLKPKRLLRPIE
jgi:hypothetical protein